MKSKPILAVLFASVAAAAALSAMPAAVRAGQIFVVTGGIEEFDSTTGALITYNLTGSNVSPGVPAGIVASGNDLYVPAGITGTIGEYTTSGATVNASFITGFPPYYGSSLAVSGNDLFVANTGGTVGEYDATTGAAINAALVTGLSQPAGIAAVTPEPSTWVMFVIGAAALLACGIRKRRPQG